MTDTRLLRYAEAHPIPRHAEDAGIHDPWKLGLNILCDCGHPAGHHGWTGLCHRRIHTDNDLAPRCPCTRPTYGATTEPGWTRIPDDHPEG